MRLPGDIREDGVQRGITIHESRAGIKGDKTGAGYHTKPWNLQRTGGEGKEEEGQQVYHHVGMLLGVWLYRSLFPLSLFMMMIPHSPLFSSLVMLSMKGFLVASSDMHSRLASTITVAHFGLCVDVSYGAFHQPISEADEKRMT
jgi:hypothetical protein